MKGFSRVSALFPKGFVKRYEALLAFAGKDADKAREFLGLSLAIGFAGFTLFFFGSVLLGLKELFPLVLGLLGFVAGIGAFYVYLVLVADSRASQVEQVLPDALQLISANIRAGMTIDKAIWLCARPEFGPLEKELKRMAADTMAGKPITDSLLAVTRRVKSVLLDRAILLLVQGIRLGGTLASLLLEISNDIRTSQALRREIDAATATYTFFIIFASVVAAPALFAVSTFYVQATTKILTNQASSSVAVGGSTTKTGTIGGLGGGKTPTGIGGSTSTGGASAGSGLTPDELFFYALTSITVSTSFGALIIGMIRYGEAKRGIKFIPLFVLPALGIYVGVLSVISSALGSVIR